MLRGEIMKIGNVKLDNNLVLAPMAGVTDLAFRILCKEMGVGLVVSEMVSSKGIYYKDPATKLLTAVDPKERPIAIQIFGSDPDIMGKIVRDELNHRADVDIIDINMGCPAPKIVKNGDGSALMKDEKLARDIIRSVVKSTKKPVTVKSRMGWDMSNLNGVTIGKIAEEEGAKAFTIHARTRDMFYSGKADWEYIKEVKSQISIPVIGNGDIFSPEDALKMLEYTGCDGVAIGRGAQGNPWIFKGILEMQGGRDYSIPDIDDRIELILRHFDLIRTFKGDRVGIREMRKHIAWYIKGLKNSNEVKDKINKLESMDQIVMVLEEYRKSLKEL